MVILKQPAFRTYPLSSISPRGWFAKQLRIQADGLSGHLDEFWPDIRDSAWIGGEAEGWERMPYWLDGVIPLAWLINNKPLKRRINEYLDYIITHQHEDGWLGPRVEEKKEAADLWSQFLALKMLVVYHDATGDRRVPGVVERSLRMLDLYTERHHLFDWGRFRWFEILISIWWLYERTGGQWLIDLAVKLHAQGFHWPSFFEYWPLIRPTEKHAWTYAGHVVNNAMAPRAGALWWRLTGMDRDKDAAHTMIAALEKYHGMATGMFTGDECLAGTDPTQGTELCAVVEYMYSLECLVSILGDSAFADRLEMLAFNALPATFAPDMWSHQYDQQVNQIECSVVKDRNWTTNSADANTFGLEPNYGCCTANLSQGWPKFAAHFWMQAGPHGVAAVAYAPSRLKTTIRNVPVSVELQTDYPFRQDLHFTVRSREAVAFPLFLRIPGWAEGATVEVEGKLRRVRKGTTFHKLDRIWEGETRITLSLPMAPRIIRRPGNAIAIQRGPLVYALKMAEEWRRINADRPLREEPHADWEVYPATSWNYALVTDGAMLDHAVVFEEHAIRSPVFSPGNAPVTATVKARRVPEWKAENGSAGPTPSSPVRGDQPLEEVVLIPYGCTNLRIAEFPTMRP